MGKSLRSQAQKRNRAVMREKVFGPAREKVELEIAKRLHGEETLKRKAQEKAEKENGEYKQTQDTHTRLQVSGGVRRCYRTRDIGLSLCSLHCLP